MLFQAVLWIKETEMSEETRKTMEERLRRLQAELEEQIGELEKKLKRD